MKTDETSNAIEALEEEYNEHMRLANGLRAAIDVLKRKQQNESHNAIEESKKAGYDIDAPIKGKIMFLLKREQRFLHIREMADLAHELEPTVSVEEFQKRFSPGLSALKREEKITNFRVDNSVLNTFWGVERWLGPEGAALPKHGPNQKYITQQRNDYEI